MPGLTHPDMMKNLGFFTLALLAVMVIVSSCTKNESDREMSKVIKIGALLPLTGSGLSTGESVNAALSIALEDVNAYLAEMRPECRIELTIRDTESDTLTTVQEYNSLKAAGIQTIIGPCISANLAAVKPLADRDGIMLVSPVSVASSLSLPGDNVFRLVPDVVSQAEAMAALLNDDEIQVVLPVVRDDLWGHDLLDALTQQFLLCRKGVVTPILYDPAATDFTTVAASLSEMVGVLRQTYTENQIGIYMLAFNEGTQLLHAVSSDSGLSAVRWYGNSGFAENKTVLYDLTAAAFAMHTGLANPSFGYNPDARSKWGPIVEELQTELGRKPEIYALAAYDALWIITLAYLSTSETSSVESLKKAFVLRADDYFGATGWTTLNENGDRAVATYDFWGIRWITNDYVWTTVARYNNATKELIRLR